jgi:hypothetical protein
MIVDLTPFPGARALGDEKKEQVGYRFDPGTGSGIRPFSLPFFHSTCPQMLDPKWGHDHDQMGTGQTRSHGDRAHIGRFEYQKPGFSLRGCEW